MLIELMLGEQGVSLDERIGVGLRLNGFLFDMNRFFQALISRFLHEHLSDAEVRDEVRIKGIFKYVAGQNPWSRKDPILRPDFVLMRAGHVAAILDAKYRDLWVRALPREMLYQLALYALGQGGGDRIATILYPSLDDAAREQSIAIHDPVGGMPPATVMLRPVHLPKLERLLRAGRSGHPQRVEFATRIAFGQTLNRIAL